MGQFSEKVLWTVFMRNDAEEARLLRHALAMGATGVAVRTSNLRLVNAIPRFHEVGMRVYGWRWPARSPTSSPPHYYAADQAKYVANTLIPAGLDGFFPDIESDNDKGSNDWDDAAHAQLARDFCKVIKAAAPDDFVFALTSGAPQPFNNKNIPWSPFVEASDYLLAQTYWRIETDKGLVAINGGKPLAAIAVGDKRWTPISADKVIVPMLGELDAITTDEIAEYGSALVARGETRLHVYTDTAQASQDKIEALAAL